MTRKIVRKGRPSNVDEDGVISDSLDMTAPRTVRTVRASNGVDKPDRPTMDRQSATGHLRAVPMGSGVPAIPKMVEELQDMTDVLLGRRKPPIDAGHLTLMEVADAYFARASELTMKLQEAEREGQITRGSAHYRFRTGELRTFMEMAKRAADLGSRRLTEEQLHWEMAMYGRETKGGVPR
jgi:hypothetical protein